MTTVALMNGVPETSRIWDDLQPGLGQRSIVRLSPPGFGSPRPSGWAATVDDYIAWTISQIEEVGAPVHLLGHDWGGNLALMVASRPPDLLRSVASDTFGAFSPDYVWHPTARTWQTPGRGEAHVAERAALPAADRARSYVGLGMPAHTAAAIAPAFDEDMARCILYRSALQPRFVEEGGRLRSLGVPALAIVAENDTVAGPHDQHRDVAADAGADVVVLDGVGHWWMAEDPAGAAASLLAHWDLSE